MPHPLLQIFLPFTDYWFKTIFHPYFFRAQNLYCWSGQCRKNDDIVSVPYERSCTHITHHWFKCRRGGMEKRPLYHVGPGRSRISTRRLEHLLLKHRSELYTYIKVRWLQGRTWHIKITTITKKIKKLVNTAVLFGAIKWQECLFLSTFRDENVHAEVGRWKKRDKILST